ncbi:MAG TPA: hypothetical protein VFT18_06720 [Gaiellaceae bacterium]|nr:hypothetical protein [Gaiellaceae bacterium]
MSRPSKAGMPPPPFLICVDARWKVGFVWSRFGPTVPEVPASANVWHEPQFVVKSDFGSFPPPPPPPVVWIFAFGFAATRETYSATASASAPERRSSGIGGTG